MALVLALAATSMASTTIAIGKPTVGYYRFENSYTGQGGLIDSSNYQRYGIVSSGEPTYVSDRPVHIVPRTGKVDKAGVIFSTQDAAYFSYPFPLQAFATSTVEFWVKPLFSGAEQDIIWGSTSTSDSDSNHYVIGLAANGQNLFVNYSDPSGVVHNLGSSDQPLPANEWSYVAIVRDGAEYRIYLNNTSTHGKTKIASRVLDKAPNIPTATQFSLNGRAKYADTTCCQADVVLDELRFSSKALKSSEFLIAP